MTKIDAKDQLPCAIPPDDWKTVYPDISRYRNMGRKSLLCLALFFGVVSGSVLCWIGSHYGLFAICVFAAVAFITAFLAWSSQQENPFALYASWIYDTVPPTLLVFACLLAGSKTGAAETLARQIETLENRAQDLEQARNYTSALHAIDDALDVAKSLNPYDEKVSELRARHLRYLLLSKPFSQFKLEMSGLIKDAPSIERGFRGADAVVELSNLHEILLDYAIKNASVDAFKLDLELSEDFKKCNFSPSNVVRELAKRYIRKGDYKVLAGLGQQYNQFTKGQPTFFGHYLIFLSMDKTGKKKEAASYMAKFMTPRSGGEVARLETDVRLSNAMRDALQFDDALSLTAKVINALKGLEQHCAGTKQMVEKISYLSLEASCSISNCRLAAQKKNYQMMLDNARRGKACMDEVIKFDPRLGKGKESENAYKDLQEFEEQALRAQGKTAQANQLRADRSKKRFGITFE